MYKGQDGWVPFSEMQQEIQRGVTEAVTNPPRNLDDLNAYVARRADEIRAQYSNACYSDDSHQQYICGARYQELQHLADFMGMRPLPELR